MSPLMKNKLVPDTLIQVGRRGAVYQQKVYRPTEIAYGSTHENAEEYQGYFIFNKPMIC